jgi:hypothetical protein
MSTLTPQRARALLGLPLSGPLSQEEIVSAWRKAVRANHSDRSGDDTLATDTLLSKKILLQEMEFPDLSWKTGKGGRPPLISDLQPDSIYSGSDVEDFLDLLVKTIKEGPTRVLVRLGFRELSSTFVQVFKGKCIYTRPNVGPKTSIPGTIEGVAPVAQELRAIPSLQILTIQPTEPPKLPGFRNRAWILWKTGVRQYHSLDFYLEPK